MSSINLAYLDRVMEPGGAAADLRRVTRAAAFVLVLVGLAASTYDLRVVEATENRFCVEVRKDGRLYHVAGPGGSPQSGACA